MDTGPEDVYAEAYETIRNELNCPMCMEPFTQPKSLSCGHAFCSNCLHKAVKTNQYTDTLNCPTCRRPSVLTCNGVDGLPNNYHLINLIEKLNQNQQTRAAQQPMQSNVSSTSNSCEEHGRTKDLFCDDCGIGICALCFVEKHKQHTVNGMQEKVDKSIELLRGLAIDSHYSLEQASKTIETLKAEKKALNQHKDKVLRDVSAYFQVLHETITNRERLICETVNKYYQLKLSYADRALTPLNTEFILLSQNIVEMKSVTNDCPLAYITKLGNTVQEVNAKMTKLFEDTGKHDFSQQFLTFCQNGTLQGCISETGGLNECVVIEKGDKEGTIEAFKVKRRLLIKQESTARIRFESSNSPAEDSTDNVDNDDDENIYDTPFYANHGNNAVKTRKESTAKQQGAPPHRGSTDHTEVDIYDEVCEYISVRDHNKREVLKPPKIPERPATPDVPHPTHQLEDSASYSQFKSSNPTPTRTHSQILPPIGIIGSRIFTTSWNLKEPIQPWGIAVSTDKIYVSDTGNHCVLVFTADGHLSKMIGTHGKGNGQFRMPVDVALDEKSNVYVADRINGSVQKFDHKGKFKLLFKNGDLPTDQVEPNGIAVFRSKVFVSDKLNRMIYTFDQQGVYLTAIHPFKIFGDNPFQPAGIAIHPRFEKIFVTDRCNHQVLVFNNDGDHIDTIGTKGTGEGQLQFPNGIAITINDQLIVTETENNRISVFDSNTGNFIRAFGQTGEEEGMFIIPRHVAINIHGEVYVTDQNNHRIQVFKLQEEDKREVVEDPYICFIPDPTQVYAR